MEPNDYGNDFSDSDDGLDLFTDDSGVSVDPGQSFEDFQNEKH